MLQCFLPNLFHRPRPVIQRFLPSRTPLNHPFHLAEYKFHEDGLRTGPATKQPAVYHGKQNDKDDKRDHPHRENEEILGPENLSEEDKLTVQDINQERRCVVDLDKRQDEKNQQVNVSGNITIPVELTCWF